MDVRGEPMCLEVGLHLFVSIGENFLGPLNHTNCTDKAEHRHFKSIRGNFGLEVSLSRAKWWLGTYDQPDWHSNDIRRSPAIRK